VLRAEAAGGSLERGVKKWTLGWRTKPEQKGRISFIPSSFSYPSLALKD